MKTMKLETAMLSTRVADSQAMHLYQLWIQVAFLKNGASQRGQHHNELKAFASRPQPAKAFASRDALRGAQPALAHYSHNSLKPSLQV